MFIILLKLFSFFSILFLFGWFFSLYALKERTLFVLIPLSFSLGISFYLILVNLVSYFIPVNTVFYLILLLFLIGIVAGLYFYFRNKPLLETGISKKYFNYLILITIFICITGWLINIPVNNVDVNRTVLSGTILGGNFPVKSILTPWKAGIFHYGFQLLSSAADRISGLSFWFIDDILMGIFSGLIFLLSFVLIHKLIKNEFIALMGSILFFFSSGLNVFYIFRGPIDIFKYYILGDQSSAAFKFVDLATRSSLRPNMMNMISLRWPAIGFVEVLLIIYFYFKILESKNNKEIIALSVLTGLLLGFLSLSAESFFVLIFGTIIASSFLFFVFGYREKDRRNIKHIFVALIILSISLLMFIYQGGIFSSFKENKGINKLGISFNIVESIKLLEPEFSSLLVFVKTVFMTFGLGLFLIIPAIIYFKKNKKILFFILPLIVISIVPVLFGRFILQEFGRFLYLTGTFMYLVSGLFIISLITKTDNIKRFILYLIFFVIIGGGLFLQIFNTGKTLAMPDREMFFAQLPASELIDYNVKQWIDDNTTIDDYFFTEIDDNLYSDLGLREYYFAQNLSFITYYGRFVPIMYRIQEAVILVDAPLEWFDYIREAKAHCTNKSLEKLNIKYIYITPQWPEGLAEKCLGNNELELVFRSGGNKIYKKSNISK